MHLVFAPIGEAMCIVSLIFEHCRCLQCLSLGVGIMDDNLMLLRCFEMQNNPPNYV